MMAKSLRFISISHKTASVVFREEYHISDAEKSELVALVCSTFPDIKGLLLLVTCNRTEIYFESTATTDIALRDFLIGYKSSEDKTGHKKLFNTGNKTEESVKHLLKVSSGLASSVLGDVEIIHQIKKAYQYSIEQKMQGSLLERALQTVFRSHKRISNETHFRDGTTSVAYKALKVVTSTFGQTIAQQKKILFIGAGDIVLQLFKYNSKFNFGNIHISNRTQVKARSLAKKNNCKVYDWDKVLANDFKNFDVIVSAASNCSNLVRKITGRGTKTLLIDLALPGNIDKGLAQNDNVLCYDLDSISKELEENQDKRLAAIGNVEKIISEELQLYATWLQEAPLRSLLKEYKIIVHKKVIGYLKAEKEAVDDQMVKIVTDRVIRKLKKQTDVLSPIKEINDIIAEQASL